MSKKKDLEKLKKTARESAENSSSRAEEIEVARLVDEHGMRLCLFKHALWFVWGWLFFAALVTVAQFFISPMGLGEHALMVFYSAFTANIMSLLFVITRYLFNTKKI